MIAIKRQDQIRFILEMKGWFYILQFVYLIDKTKNKTCNINLCRKKIIW